MKAPLLLGQCFPGLLPSKATSCVPIVSEKDLQLPSPAVEIIPSKSAHPYKYAGEKVDVQGFDIFKGKVSVADMIAFSPSEVASSKSDGTLKYWESSITLVNILKNEIRDGQLSFRGKRVLELGCGSGLSGIFACLKGASTVHFQDINAETIRCRTIPNVLANLEQARDRQNRPSESPVTPSRQVLAPNVHFYAGEWDELPTILSVVQPPAAPTNLSFSEDDFMDGCSSHDGSSIVGHDYCPRRSRKLSGSRAWERASETDQADGGYDVILISDVPYSVNSLKKLYALISKCLRPPPSKPFPSRCVSRRPLASLVFPHPFSSLAFPPRRLAPAPARRRPVLSRRRAHRRREGWRVLAGGRSGVGGGGPALR